MTIVKQSAAAAVESLQPPLDASLRLPDFIAEGWVKDSMAAQMLCTPWCGSPWLRRGIVPEVGQCLFMAVRSCTRPQCTLMSNSGCI